MPEFWIGPDLEQKKVGVSSPPGLSTKFWPLSFAFSARCLAHTVTNHPCILQIVSTQAGWPCRDRHPHALKELHYLEATTLTHRTPPHPSHTPNHSHSHPHPEIVAHICPCHLHPCAGRSSQTHIPTKLAYTQARVHMHTPLTRMHWRSGVLCAGAQHCPDV